MFSYILVETETETDFMVLAQICQMFTSLLPREALKHRLKFPYTVKKNIYIYKYSRKIKESPRSDKGEESL